MSQSIRLQQFSLPLERPLGTADGEIASREGFLVGLEEPAGSGGILGVGEATPLPGWTESIDDCAAALRDPPERWEASADDRFSETMPQTSAARHGYRLARLDAAARAEDRSLAALLAERAEFPAPAESVPVNATVGDGPVSDTVAAAEEAVDTGFDCLKIKVGARSLSADVDRIRAVREAVDATLRVDANGAWKGESARDAVDAFASLGVAYVEQPVPAGELAEMHALRGRGVAIAADEAVGEHGIDTLLDADAADVAVLKPMVLGGPDAAVDAARRLRKNGVDPVVTTTIDGAVARAAAVHVAAAVPNIRACGLATGGLLEADFGPDPVPVETGRVGVPEGPGNVGEDLDARLWD